MQAGGRVEGLVAEVFQFANVSDGRVRVETLVEAARRRRAVVVR